MAVTPNIVISETLWSDTLHLLLELTTCSEFHKSVSVIDIDTAHFPVFHALCWSLSKNTIQLMLKASWGSNASCNFSFKTQLCCTNTKSPLNKMLSPLGWSSICCGGRVCRAHNGALYLDLSARMHHQMVLLPSCMIFNHTAGTALRCVCGGWLSNQGLTSQDSKNLDSRFISTLPIAAMYGRIHCLKPILRQCLILQIFVLYLNLIFQAANKGMMDGMCG